MEDETAQAPVGFVLKDGSLHRLPNTLFPDLPPNPEFHDGVASKDVMLDPACNLWVRIYKPQVETGNNKLLPVLVFFHGGGFLYGSAGMAFFHKLCEQICKKLGGIIVSVNYRLAPEHRLPAAYEDGFSVLNWLESCSKKQTTEAWLEDPDFTRVFVSGDSAGGNLAHHVTLRAAHEPGSLSIKLAGQLLIEPFFGGVLRTESELKFGNGAVITVSGCDMCWKVALPEGVSRDHEFSNPALTLREKAEKGFVPKTLVVVGGLDLLQDRQVEYAKILEEAGKKVKLVVYEKADHGFYINDCKETDLLLDEMVGFCTSVYKELL